MKKRFFLLVALTATLLFSCSGPRIEDPAPTEVDEDDIALLDDALNHTEVHTEQLLNIDPLEIAAEAPASELTQTLYDFGTTNGDTPFSVVDKDDHPAVPYASNSNVYVGEEDVVLYDNYGQNYPVKSFVEGYGKGDLVVQTSEFNKNKVYYLELKNEKLAFQGKDPDIRRLTFYTLNRGIAAGKDVDYKDDIVTLDSTKVYYYDEDGYSPFFVYEYNPELDAGTSFRIRHPSIEKDNLDTVYGKVLSINRNPNGAGYMVRYDPAKANDVFKSLSINESKRIDENDDITLFSTDDDAGDQLAQAIIHNPSMVTSIYGLMNAFDVKPNHYERSIIDWGSRIDIKFGTSFDISTATFTFSVNASYTFYPSEHLAITLNLGYKQTWRYDVTASVSIETEFIFPVGVNYTLKVVEDTTKEISFGVWIKYDHSGEYDEEKTKESIEKAMADAFWSRSDWPKKSVFTGEGPTSTPGGASYPLFKISCNYFLPIEIYFEVDFYWEMVPSAELLIKYTSHTQRVDLCVSNQGGADPSSESATKTNETLSFNLIGKVHFEAGFKISIGVTITGFYKFFHVEVYLKVYGAVDIQGYFTTEISWNDDVPTRTNVSIGAKFEISVGLKVGIDIYLLFGGYNHEWPFVAVVLFGAECGFPLQTFVNEEEDIYINDKDYDADKKQFNLTLGERHLLTARILNTNSFSIDIMDLEYNSSAKAVYGAFVPEDVTINMFDPAVLDTKEGTLVSPLTVSEDGHLCMDTILDQDNFIVDMTITGADGVCLGEPPVKTVHIHFENTDRQLIYIDFAKYGSFVNGATIVLPVPTPQRYKKFLGYTYEDPYQPFGPINIDYDEDNPSSFTYTVNTRGGEASSRYLESRWIDWYHWEVYFVDGLNNIIEKQMVLNGEAATEPDPEVRDLYMKENPPDNDHVYEFVGWDRAFDEITGPTVVRAKYRIKNK